MRDWNQKGQFENSLQVKRGEWHHTYSIQSLWPEDASLAFTKPPKDLSSIHLEEEESGLRKRASLRGTAIHEFKKWAKTFKNRDDPKRKFKSEAESESQTGKKDLLIISNIYYDVFRCVMKWCICA
jgi:hypothetical protein